MRVQYGRWAVVAAVLWSTGARATQLYLGLPNGRAAAYEPKDGGWSHVAYADLPDVGSGAMPALADLDGDGDLDAIVGNTSGNLTAFENTGTTTGPIWTARPAWDPPRISGAAGPALVDVDGDGRPDLLVGAGKGIVALAGGDGVTW